MLKALLNYFPASRKHREETISRGFVRLSVVFGVQ